LSKSRFVIPLLAGIQGSSEQVEICHSRAGGESRKTKKLDSGEQRNDDLFSVALTVRQDFQGLFHIPWREPGLKNSRNDARK
jgi:hypothetical protein